LIARNYLTLRLAVLSCNRFRRSATKARATWLKALFFCPRVACLGGGLFLNRSLPKLEIGEPKSAVGVALIGAPWKSSARNLKSNGSFTAIKNYPRND
jgi:hypothetical protein